MSGSMEEGLSAARQLFVDVRSGRAEEARASGDRLCRWLGHHHGSPVATALAEGVEAVLRLEVPERPADLAQALRFALHGHRMVSPREGFTPGGWLLLADPVLVPARLPLAAPQPVLVLLEVFATTRLGDDAAPLLERWFTRDPRDVGLDRDTAAALREALGSVPAGVAGGLGWMVQAHPDGDAHGWDVEAAGGPRGVRVLRSRLHRGQETLERGRLEVAPGDGVRVLLNALAQLALPSEVSAVVLEQRARSVDPVAVRAAPSEQSFLTASMRAVAEAWVAAFNSARVDSRLTAQEWEEVRQRLAGVPGLEQVFGLSLLGEPAADVERRWRRVGGYVASLRVEPSGAVRPAVFVDEGKPPATRLLHDALALLGEAPAEVPVEYTDAEERQAATRVEDALRRIGTALDQEVSATALVVGAQRLARDHRETLGALGFVRSPASGPPGRVFDEDAGQVAGWVSPGRDVSIETVSTRNGTALIQGRSWSRSGPEPEARAAVRTLVGRAPALASLLGSVSWDPAQTAVPPAVKAQVRRVISQLVPQPTPEGAAQLPAFTQHAVAKLLGALEVPLPADDTARALTRLGFELGRPPAPKWYRFVASRVPDAEVRLAHPMVSEGSAVLIEGSSVVELHGFEPYPRMLSRCPDREREIWTEIQEEVRLARERKPVMEARRAWLHARRGEAPVGWGLHRILREAGYREMDGASEVVEEYLPADLGAGPSREVSEHALMDELGSCLMPAVVKVAVVGDHAAVLAFCRAWRRGVPALVEVQAHWFPEDAGRAAWTKAKAVFEARVKDCNPSLDRLVAAVRRGEPPPPCDAPRVLVTALRQVLTIGAGNWALDHGSLPTETIEALSHVARDLGVSAEWGVGGRLAGWLRPFSMESARDQLAALHTGHARPAGVVQVSGFLTDEAQWLGLSSAPGEPKALFVVPGVADRPPLVAVQTSSADARALTVFARDARPLYKDPRLADAARDALLGGEAVSPSVREVLACRAQSPGPRRESERVSDVRQLVNALWMVPTPHSEDGSPEYTLSALRDALIRHEFGRQGIEIDDRLRREQVESLARENLIEIESGPIPDYWAVERRIDVDHYLVRPAMQRAGSPEPMQKKRVRRRG